MVKQDVRSDEGSESCDDVERWVQRNMVGDQIPTMEDYPSVYPITDPKVNVIATVAKDPTREQDFDWELARQMNQLNVRERERKFEEMHGVSSFVDETPESVENALFQIEQELAAIPVKNAYDLAYKMDRTYIESRKFRLMFLRAELFDSRKAAERLVLFLEKKLLFFGPATLVRSIQMSDLADEDILTLKGGAFQILSSRDRSGRPIFFKCSNCGPKLYTSLLSYCRCWWYRTITLVEEDEETQKRGVVVLVWWMDYLRKDPDVNPELRKEIFGAIRWLPVRPYNSIHICMDGAIGKKLLARVQIALSPPEIRYNYKIHSGSQTEVMYSLMSYGIPTEAIPVSASGGIKIKDLHKWITRRQYFERFPIQNGSTHLFEKIDLPKPSDVLLAKGRPFQNHPGNLEYLQLIQEYLSDYDGTKNRKGKRDVVGTFVNAMRATKSARFLTKDEDDCWMEAPDKEVHDKVLKSFSHASSVARKKSTTAHPPVKACDVSLSGKRKRLEPSMDGGRRGNKKYLNQTCFVQTCFVLHTDWSRG